MAINLSVNSRLSTHEVSFTHLPAKLCQLTCMYVFKKQLCFAPKVFVSFPRALVAFSFPQRMWKGPPGKSKPPPPWQKPRGSSKAWDKGKGWGKKRNKLWAQWDKSGKGWGDGGKGWDDGGKGWDDDATVWDDGGKGWDDGGKGWDGCKGWDSGGKGWDGGGNGWDDGGKGWDDCDEWCDDVDGKGWQHTADAGAGTIGAAAADVKCGTPTPRGVWIDNVTTPEEEEEYKTALCDSWIATDPSNPDHTYCKICGKYAVPRHILHNNHRQKVIQQAKNPENWYYTPWELEEMQKKALQQAQQGAQQQA